MSTSDTYGRRIAQLRSHLGLTVQQLADKIGISKGYLGDIEADRSQPSRRVILSLTNNLNVNYEWLVDGTGHMLKPIHDRYVFQLKEMRKEMMKKWIDEFWNDANEDEKTWLEVQMRKSFPEYQEWLKRNEGGNQNVMQAK